MHQLKPKILLAEDDHAQLTILTKLLQKNGFFPIAATNGQEALRLAKTACPNLIIMDYCMPLLNGIETMRILKKDNNTKNIPIIIISSENVREVGCVFLSKPFAMQDLNNLINKLIIY